MSKKVKRLAVGLLILSLSILINGCESCSNNTKNPSGPTVNKGTSISANNNSSATSSNNNRNSDNPNNTNDNGGIPTNNPKNDGAPSSELTNDMISSVRDAKFAEFIAPEANSLINFLEKMQRGEPVDIEEEISGPGTPLGTLCLLFLLSAEERKDYSLDRLLLFDYLVSKGASLNGVTPGGQTILEVATIGQSDDPMQLTEHILKKYKDKIDSATVKKAYEHAKANDRQGIVKLFNDVGIDDQYISKI